MIERGFITIVFLSFVVLLSAQQALAESAGETTLCGGLLEQYLNDPGAFGVEPGYFGPLEDLISEVTGGGADLEQDAQQALEAICNHLAQLMSQQIFPVSDDTGPEPTPNEPPVDIVDTICNGLIYTAECLEVIGKVDPTPVSGLTQWYLYSCAGDPGLADEALKGVVIGILNPIKNPLCAIIAEEIVGKIVEDPDASSWDGTD